MALYFKFGARALAHHGDRGVRAVRALLAEPKSYSACTTHTLESGTAR